MSWELISRSFRVLRQDPKLLVFPILSALAGLAIIALYFFSPLSGDLFRRSSERHALDATQYVTLFLGYVAFYFAMVFFNCALAACAQARFAGGEPSIGYGLSRAAGRIGPILMWALLAATIGLVLQAIEERVGFLARIVTRIFGFAWNMATYLVVPVLVIEDADAVASIRRSASLLRKSWGEQLTVGLALGWSVLLFAVPGIILGAIGAAGYPVALAAGVFYLALVGAAATAVHGIFDVALYRYATTGEVPDGYSSAILNGAFVNLKKP
jgi:hypothetical protein